MTGWTRSATLWRVIPDIALMIAIYGAARLLTAALEPHRGGNSTMALVATALHWSIAVGATLALAVLAIMVLGSSQSLSGLTG